MTSSGSEDDDNDDTDDNNSDYRAELLAAASDSEPGTLVIDEDPGTDNRIIPETQTQEQGHGQQHKRPHTTDDDDKDYVPKYPEGEDWSLPKSPVRHSKRRISTMTLPRIGQLRLRTVLLYLRTDKLFG